MYNVVSNKYCEIWSRIEKNEQCGRRYAWIITVSFCPKKVVCFSRAVKITSWSICQDWSGFWNTLTHGQNSSRRVSNDSTVHPLIAALTLYHSQYKRCYWCALQEMKVQPKRPQCVCVRTLHLPLRVSACFRPASHNWPVDWHDIGQLGFTEVLTAAVKTQFWLRSTNSMKGNFFVEEMSKNEEWLITISHDWPRSSANLWFIIFS